MPSFSGLFASWTAAQRAAPEEYTVGEILRLSEGELAPVACLAQGSSPCQRRGQCKTLTMWNQFYQMTNQFFDGITIAQLMENKL